MKTHTTTMFLRIAASLFILHSSLFIGAALRAQAVAQPNPATDAQPAPRPVPVVTELPAAPAASADDEIVELSKFVVTGAQDDGYAAMNTTSGSRISTPLRDIASPISVLTEEFLTDIGAETLEDMLSFVPNVSMEFGDTSFEFESTETLSAGFTNSGFRIRDLPASLLVDGISTVLPRDGFNTSGMEVARGANAILFGIGSPGGVISFQSKRANVRRNFLTLRNTFSAWNDSPNTGLASYRATIDYNLVLVPRKLAFRLNGLYVDNKSWRYWEFTRDKRLAPSFTAKPFKDTTIYVTYQGGTRRNATTRLHNMENRVLSWANAAGPDDKFGPVMQDFGTAFAVPGTRQIQANYNRYVFVNNNGMVINTRQSYESWEDGDRVFLLPPTYSPWEYSTIGPGGIRNQKFRDFFVSLEQKIGIVNFELSWIGNQNDASAYSPSGARGQIQGDPNLYVANPIWVDNPTSVNLIENPYKGELYSEDVWRQGTSWRKNDAFRLTATFELDLKKYGRHRFIGFLEHSKSKLLERSLMEILVDENQYAITNINEPAHTRNRVFRRNYLTVGKGFTNPDFRTYYQAPPFPALSGILTDSMNQYFRSAWILTKGAGTHVDKKMNSGLIALQSSMLKGRLKTVLGLRMDEVTFTQQWPLTPISDAMDPITGKPTDPRYYMIENKTRVVNEYDFHPNYWRKGSYKPSTFSLGGVYHLPWFNNRISPAINFSSSRGLPPLDGRTVLPNGDIPPLIKGQSFDYGIKFDVFGDGRLTGSILRYETKMVGDTFAPNGLDNDYSNALGSSNLYNIYDALYFMRTTNKSGMPRDPRINTKNFALITPPGASANSPVYNPASGESLVNTVDHAGPMTSEQYNVAGITNEDYPFGRPLQYNAALVDVYSKGYEFEITGKITKNLSIRASVSYTDRSRTNIMEEIFAYYNANIAKWMEMADPAKNGGYQYWVNITGFEVANNQIANSMIPGTRIREFYRSGRVNPDTGVEEPSGTKSTLVRLDDFIWNQLYALTNAATIDAGSSLRGGIAGQMRDQAGQNALRPWKGNLTLTYNFPNTSTFKGLRLSASCIYQSANRMPNPNRRTFSYFQPGRDMLTLDFDPTPYYENATMINGQSILRYDCMARYRCKIFGRNNLTIQVNVINVLNKHDPLVGRKNALGYVDRYYLVAPRQFRLTATIEF